MPHHAYRRVAAAAAVSVLAASASFAQPVDCGARPLSIRARMDTPTSIQSVPLPESPNAVVNVGQRVTLVAFWGEEPGDDITGSEPVVPTDWVWSIEGPVIKEYFELLGVEWVPVAPPPPNFQTLQLRPADLENPRVSFYWKPTPQQVHPNPGDAVDHAVTLTATSNDGTQCIVTARYSVERNTDDSNLQPEDFYTSNHRGLVETNPAKGAVIDEHMLWHAREGLGGFGQPDFTFWMRFLPWHRAFLTRFADWRTEFGYPPVEVWDPATELLVGPAYDHPAAQRNPVYDRETGNTPTWLSLTGGVDTLGGRVPPGIPSFPADLNLFSGIFEVTFHGLPHCLIGPGVDDFFGGSGLGFGSMCAASSPKDPMFWRWHGFVDVLYTNYCTTHLASCTGDTFPSDVTDLWIAENNEDIAAVGTEPTTGPVGGAPEVWNRRAPAICNPEWPRDGVARTCGPALHENPVQGTDNYLYLSLRNDRQGSATARYAEVAVWEGDAAGNSAALVNPLLPDPFIPGLNRLASHAVVLGLPAGAVTTVGPIIWRPVQGGSRRLVVQVSTPDEVGPLVANAPIELGEAETAAVNSNSVVIKDVTVDTSGIVMGLVPSKMIAASPCVALDADQLHLTTSGDEVMLTLGDIQLGRWSSQQPANESLTQARARTEVCAFHSGDRAMFTVIR